MASNQRKGSGEWVSWALIGGLLFVGVWWLALPLLLWKLYGKDATKKTASAPPLQETARVDTRINKTGGTLYQSASDRAAEKKPASRAKATVGSVTKTPADKTSTARILQVVGILLMLLGLMAFSGSNVTSLREVLWELLDELPFFVGGGAMAIKGFTMSRSMKRYAKYLAVMGTREAVSVEELARTLGFSRSQVEKDLKKMAEKGYFGDSAYLNMELGYLFRSSEADRAWQEKQRAAQAAAPKEAEEGYSGILRNIRRANDEIADPVLSAKIDQLESITARIFKAVEEDPNKAKRIDNFLNYYLPTTQKLLDSYAQFEAAGVEGENLTQAKNRIASTMDAIIKGFAHQLDELYKMDAMDVDSDIRVMETMLRRDTASTAEDFGLDGGSAVQQREE